MRREKARDTEKEAVAPGDDGVSFRDQAGQCGTHTVLEAEEGRGAHQSVSQQKETALIGRHKPSGRCVSFSVYPSDEESLELAIPLGAFLGMFYAFGQKSGTQYYGTRTYMLHKKKQDDKRDPQPMDRPKCGAILCSMQEGATAMWKSPTRWYLCATKYFCFVYYYLIPSRYW